MKKQLSLTTLTTAAGLLVGLAAAQAAEAPAPVAAGETTGITIKLPDLAKAAEKAKVKVSGYAQAQYLYTDTKGNAHNANSGFAIRRAAISVKGEIDENWSSEVGFEIDSGNKGGKLGADNSTIFVDKAIITDKGGFGKVTAGYQKPRFVMEEYASSKTQLCIEQSVATVYFTNLANGSLSGRHGGVWWEDKADAFKYGFAVTNQYKEDLHGDKNDGVAFYANFSYELKSDAGRCEFGLNAVYNPGNDDEATKATDKIVNDDVYGLEPYIQLTSGNFRMILDGLYADGGASQMKSAAWGMNATAAYRFDNDIEPVVRLAYLDVGDNGNIDPSKLKNVPTNGSKDYDTAFGVYLGANFYANKHIKISAGYEHTQFCGGAKSEYANGFRLQLQATF